ncbi:hypothetical protein ABT237_05990 [Streptomyces sp. NPDC001581]|uniref:hypothetical protein n=1 Tax=Streptomyces sp. NPDC001581 TaxID=3154386 RepID=UPI00331B6FE7
MCALAAVLLTAACGAPGGAHEDAPVNTRPETRTDTRTAIRQRMEQVAAAWEGSAALRQWREGFHPLGEQDWQPPGGFRSGEDKAAYIGKSFVLRTELPVTLPPATPVRWPDGSTLTLPLQSAAQAYGEIDEDPDRAPALTVTGVRFGETTVRTSRGPARVPAWLFTVEGYETPLARIAVAPQEFPKPPIEPLGTFDGGTAPLLAHTAAPGATELTVQAGHGSCDGGVAVDVLEGADTVVLAGRILPGVEPGQGGGCDAVMHTQSVTVTPARPVGARLLVDAATGAPLGEPRGKASPAAVTP